MIMAIQEFSSTVYWCEDSHFEFHSFQNLQFFGSDFQPKSQNLNLNWQSTPPVSWNPRRDFFGKELASGREIYLSSKKRVNRILGATSDGGLLKNTVCCCVLLSAKCVLLGWPNTTGVAVGRVTNERTNGTCDIFVYRTVRARSEAHIDLDR